MPPLDIYRQAMGDLGIGTRKWGIDRYAAPLGKWGIDPTAITMAPSLTGANTTLPGTSGLFSGVGQTATQAVGNVAAAPSPSSGYTSGGSSYTPTSYAPSSYAPVGAASTGFTQGYVQSTPAGGAGWENVTRWSPQVQAAIAQVEQQTGVRVPENVVYAVMELESGGEHVGYNSAGYGGLMQVGPGSNVSDWNEDYAATPEGNIYYGVQELANWYGVTGDWNTAPLAYFSGYNYDNPGVSDGHYTVADYDQHIQNNLAQLGGITGPTAAASQGAPSLSAFGPGSAANVTSSGMPQTITRTAPTSGPAGSQGGWISSVTGGQQFPLSQEFGLTDFAMGEGSGMYGYTSEYNPQGAYMGHAGLDISMEIGTPLYSPVTGVVVQAGGVEWEADERYGATPGTGGLRIQLPNGDIVVIGHMSAITPQVGETVQAGQAVGLSGTANGGHLHLEYRQLTPGVTASGYTLLDPRSVILPGSVARPSAPGATQGLFVGTGTKTAAPQNLSALFGGGPTSTVNADQYRYPTSGASSLFGGQSSQSQIVTRQLQQQRAAAPGRSTVARPSFSAAPQQSYQPGSTYVPPASRQVGTSSALGSAASTTQNAVRGLFAGTPSQYRAPVTGGLRKL